MRTEICDQLGIEFPIFAFSHCRDVVAAVTKAGGLGVLGAVGFSPEDLEVELTWLDENVGDLPYGVDIVIPSKYEGMGIDDMTPEELEAEMAKHIPQGHRDFGKQDPGRPRRPRAARGREAPRAARLDGGHRRPQVEAILRHDKAKLVANALGTPPADVIEQVQASGRLIGALCGSVKHALRHKDAGLDFVVCQGTEGGGHCGEVASMVLWPQVIDAISPMPVLAAGGIGERPAGGVGAGHGRPGRVDRVAVAHGRGGRRAAGADADLRRGDQPRHGALAVVHRQALPHAAQRLDRGLGGRRARRARCPCRCR